MAMENTSLQVENGSTSNARSTPGEGKSACWWKPPSWSNKTSDGVKNVARDATRTGISERPQCQRQCSPRGRSRKPKKVVASSPRNRPRSSHKKK
eukprot:77004_1